MSGIDVPLLGSLVRRVDGAPVASVRLLTPGGARVESDAGAALLAGRMLEEGTSRLDWRALAERIEGLGMDLAGLADYDAHGLAIDCLAEDVDAALELAFEILSDSAFSEDRFEWARRQEAIELSAIAESSEAVTGWAFRRAIYGPARAARPLADSEERLAELGPESCRAFHRRRIARGSFLTVAGAIDADRVGARVEELFGSDRPTEPAARGTRAEARRPERTNRQVATRGQDQSHVYLGHTTARRDAPDLPGLAMLSVILGGGAGNAGRVPSRVREQGGLAYSVVAELAAEPGLDPGYLFLYAGVSPQAEGPAIDALRGEVERLLDEGVTDREVADARSYLIGREPFRRETARQWADRLVERQLYGLPLVEESIEERLARWDARSLLELARRTVEPEALSVIVGSPG